MVSHVQAYVENVSELPERLKANFFEMKQMDESAQEIQRRLENLASRARESMHEEGEMKKEDARTEIEEQANMDIDALQKLCDDKVALATRTYNLVESHIQRLDRDLVRFEKELKDALIEAGETLPPYFVSKHKDNTTGTPGKMRKRNASGYKGQDEDAAYMLRDHEASMDPNEPRYCSCNDVSYGDMVACDNENCPIEWYHFGCVGLPLGTDPPDTWYCPLCRKG